VLWWCAESRGEDALPAARFTLQQQKVKLLFAFLGPNFRSPHHWAEKPGKKIINGRGKPPLSFPPFSSALLPMKFPLFFLPRPCLPDPTEVHNLSSLLPCFRLSFDFQVPPSRFPFQFHPSLSVSSPHFQIDV
jgi:hypothetical protein